MENSRAQEAFLVDLPKAVQNMELHFIRLALQTHGNNKNQAARSLGLKRTTLVEKMRRYGMALNTPSRAKEERVKSV